MKHTFQIILLFALASCGKSLPTLENFNTKLWKDDRGACKNLRIGLEQSLTWQKDKLLGLKEVQIVALLGRPDENELYQRNQKFYFYHLSPGKTCEGSNNKSKVLEIRFNAMGLAKEVFIK